MHSQGAHQLFDRVDSALSGNPTLLSALLEAASVQHYFIQKRLKGSNEMFKVTEEQVIPVCLNTATLGAWRQNVVEGNTAKVRDVQKLVMELEDMER